MTYRTWIFCLCVFLFLPVVMVNRVERFEFTLVGAGDIADCDRDNDEETARLLHNYDVVFTLGDNVYDSGTHQEYADCFHPNWGKVKGDIRPTVGNHDYKTQNAQGYKDYFVQYPDTAYHYRLGNWLIIVLDTNCKQRNCPAQDIWLNTLLENNTSRCIMAMWHHPVYSSEGGSERGLTFWQTLARHKADVVLTGHDHFYERFYKMDKDGDKSNDGIRSFIVGTGGSKLNRTGQNAKNSADFDRHHYGVIRFDINKNGYSWQFVSTDNKVRDHGSDNCN